MNALSPIKPALPGESFREAVQAVNEWRGHCLHHFARVERIITEALFSLSNVPQRGSKLRLPHLIGQRLEELTKAIEVGGPFEAEGKKAFELLNDFRTLDGLRVTLCHGAAEVTLSERGYWTAVFRHTLFRSRQIVVDTKVITEEDAAGIEGDLRDRSNRMCSQLRLLNEVAHKIKA